MPIVKPHPKSGVIEMRLGYSALRPNEYKAIKSILEGKDVFVTLPTGSGKSLCYAIFAFDDMYSHVNSIALIVSPLKALMKNQDPMPDVAPPILGEKPTLELTSQSADLEVEERVGKGEGHITAGSLQEQRHRLFVQMHSETVPNVAMQMVVKLKRTAYLELKRTGQVELKRTGHVELT
ncbi:hypothetical protein EMCRGX_G009158 [Ephydatia muelleri]